MGDGFTANRVAENEQIRFKDQLSDEHLKIIHEIGSIYNLEDYI